MTKVLDQSFGCQSIIQISWNQFIGNRQLFQSGDSSTNLYPKYFRLRLAQSPQLAYSVKLLRLLSRLYLSTDAGLLSIILVGASLGGCASAKLTVESQADGLVVVASPPEISQWGFAIEASDLDSNIPKLFITAKEDDTVPVEATQELFNLAAEPKEWKTYPGTAHGTELFDTLNKDEFQQKILEFILAIKTAN